MNLGGEREMAHATRSGAALIAGRRGSLRLGAAALAVALGLCLTAASLRAAGRIDAAHPSEAGSDGDGVKGQSAESAAHIGYGVNPYSAGDSRIGAMGFDWTKVWTGPGYRLPYRVLRRIDVNVLLAGDIEGHAQGIGNEAYLQADNIEAWEIGNEVNLGAEFGWRAPPDAATYTQMLCAIYEKIHQADPSVIVVSAGLAPVGRIPFTYSGHQGYCAPGLSWCGGWYQDEREYLREMLAAGAGNCFDALGYHPYGFLAPYDAAPGSWECGVNDFCFRGVEAIREIMVNEYGVDKPIWATEFGWIVKPEDAGRPDCVEDPSLDGFNWMTVTLEVQKQNLLGAYEYAEANYPWMGAMLLFNLGFSDHHGCNQMSFFDIKNRPAESALTGMDKNTVPAQPVWSQGVHMVEQGDPGIRSGNLRVRNLSPEPIDWAASLVSSPFPITVTETSGSYKEVLGYTADPSGLALGTHTATFATTATVRIPVPIIDGSQDVEVSILVVEEIFSAYLPLVARSYH
jgi:hypothetical protein